MRTILMMGLLLAATPAMACNEEMIAVEEWSVERGEREDSLGMVQSLALMGIDYRYDGEAPFRLIDANIRFEDALGGYISNLNIPRDEGLSPGETRNVYVENYLDAAQRLPDMHPDDVVVTTCVRSVVYEDGTTEEFN